MSRTKFTAIIAVSAILAGGLASFAPTFASQATPTVQKTAGALAWRANTAPKACDGEVFPYQSAACIAAVMDANGKSGRQVRVIALGEAGDISPAFQEVADLSVNHPGHPISTD